MNRLIPHLVLAGGLVLGGVFGFSCSSSDDDAETEAPQPPAEDASVDVPQETSVLPETGSDVFVIPDEFSDFPATPVVGNGLPTNISDLFVSQPGTDTGGPCLAEPTLGALVPSNWSPLIFEWEAPTEMNVFELTLSVDNQLNDLVVYTSEPGYTIDTDMWVKLMAHSRGKEIQITLRGASFDGSSLSSAPAKGASGVIHIAPVEAKGAVVYWDASGATSFEGYQTGESTPTLVLTPSSAGNAPSGRPTTCISCHASASKGKLLVYTADSGESGQADWSRVLDVRMMDGSGVPSPTMVSPSALELLGRNKQSAPTTTDIHPTRILSIFIEPTATGNLSEIVWTDLLAPDLNAWGIIARNGDNRQATSPSWSRDGNKIAYVSSDKAGEGVIADGDMDIYTVPYADGAGGDAEPLPGASESEFREFYPVYSPRDTLIAFNRTTENVNSYDQSSAEVFVLPAEGGTPRRLLANDPPTCTSLQSPGLTNSWPRWAPTAEEHDGKRYYWLVFSSKRRSRSAASAGDLMAQLYIAGVVTQVTSTGEEVVQDYPALYVAAQKPQARNHTPVWDYFEVPVVPK